MNSKDIKTKARQINEKSLNFHLPHAIFAVNAQLHDVFVTDAKARIAQLKDEIHKAQIAQDDKKIAQLYKEIGVLETPHQVYVQFIDMVEDGARVTKLENSLVISLSQRLAEKSMNNKGEYNVAIVQKLRKIIAHELGHIVLHTKDVLNMGGLQGTKDIRGKDKEQEADIFANELLLLRHERNE